MRTIVFSGGRYFRFPLDRTGSYGYDSYWLNPLPGMSQRLGHSKHLLSLGYHKTFWRQNHRGIPYIERFFTLSATDHLEILYNERVFLTRYLQLKNMGFSRLRKKSSHIYIIIIIFLYGGLQAPIFRQSYIMEHISHSAGPVQSCQMNTYVRSQIAYLVVEKLLCPIAFWFFGLGFWEKTVVFGNFKSIRYSSHSLNPTMATFEIRIQCT